MVLDRLLIIGGTGLVGSKLAALSSKHGFEIFITQNARTSSYVSTVQLDITNMHDTSTVIRRIRPEIIINTAALHNVDYCETHRAEAERANVDGVRNLSEAAEATNARLVHLSTDYIFDGKTGNYLESDIPNPLNYYAQTKLEAERLVSQLPNYAIARPSVIYGWNVLESTGIPSSSGKTVNFAMFVLDKLGKSEKVMAVTDQFGSPTFADNLAEALLKLARHTKNGIYHTAGRSCMNRYEFAVGLASTFGYDSHEIVPVNSNRFKQIASRPMNSCLRVEKAEGELGMRFLTAAEGIQEMKNQSLTSN